MYNDLAAVATATAFLGKRDILKIMPICGMALPRLFLYYVVGSFVQVKYRDAYQNLVYIQCLNSYTIV